MKTPDWLQRFFDSMPNMAPPIDGMPAEWWLPGDELKFEAHLLSKFLFGAAADHTRYSDTHIALSKAGSPIEKMFWAAFMCAAGEVGHKSFGIEQQVDIDSYRVDFVLTSGLLNWSGSYVVECDGHDFHERTKFQAARDKKRDRDLQAHGYAVLRFTGAEIWKSPLDVAREAIQYAVDQDYAAFHAKEAP